MMAVDPPLRTARSPLFHASIASTPKPKTLLFSRSLVHCLAFGLLHG